LSTSEEESNELLFTYNFLTLSFLYVT
jgi:hypothetical protein